VVVNRCESICLPWNNNPIEFNPASYILLGYPCTKITIFEKKETMVIAADRGSFEIGPAFLLCYGHEWS